MVKHEVNKDDLVAFQFHFIDSDKRWRVIYSLLQGLGVVLLLFVLNIARSVILHYRSAPEKINASQVSLPLALMIILGTFVVLMSSKAGRRWTTKIYVLRHYERRNMMKGLGINTIEATEAGLSTTSPSGSGVLNWDSISAIETSGSRTFIYCGLGALILNRDNVLEGDVDALLADIQRYRPTATSRAGTGFH